MFEYLFQNLEIADVTVTTYEEGFDPTYTIHFENMLNPNVLNITIEVTIEVLHHHNIPVPT